MFKRALFPSILILLSIVGFIASFTLAEGYYYLDLPKVSGDSPAIFHHLSDQACGGQDSFYNCTTVAKSPYAALFGVPLGIYGLFFYLVTLWLACTFAFTPDGWQKSAALILFWVTLLGVAEAGLLLFITLRVVKALCPLCLLTYILNLLLFISTVGHIFRNRINPLRLFAPPSSKRAPGRELGRFAAALALVIIVGAAAGVARDANAYLKQSKTRFMAGQQEQGIRQAVEAFLGQQPEAFDFTSLQVHGPAGAPVTIIEVSDFLCPYCAQAAGLLNQLAAANPEKVNIRFVNLPLDMSCNHFMQRAMHRGSCDLALGAICAAEQGKLDGYQKIAFALHKSQPSGRDIRSVVFQAGLSEEIFIECLRRSESIDILQAQIEQTNRYGITSTPAIIINRKRFKGRLSLAALQKIVDLETQTGEAKSNE